MFRFRYRPTWLTRISGIAAQALLWEGLLTAGFACSSGAETPANDAPSLSATASGKTSLRERAQQAGRLIGVALASDALATDASYQQLAAEEFDYVTAENATKWEPLAPTPETYNWADADAIVQFTQDHLQQFKGHTFVWYMQNPGWIDDLDADALLAALRSHIRTTMLRYQGKVRAWDVVNEAVDTDAATGYRENIFWKKLGPDYIEAAFRYADEVRVELDSDVLLYYNEIGIERIGPKSDFAYQMIRDLLAKGVPIDGIGFQSHISSHRYPSDVDLRANLRRFADLGLSVNLSEVDVRDTVFPGTEEMRSLAQRIAYQQIVASCVLEPACDAISFWGFTDKYSWLNDEGTFSPLLLSREYQQKPAYQGVIDGLSGKLPVRGANVVSNPNFDDGAAAWSASAGQLTVARALDREGNAACVDGRAGSADGLVQNDLLTQVGAGGPFAFSAWVRADAGGTVDASLVMTDAGQSPKENNVATIVVEAGKWTALVGYLGLGFEGTPEAVALKIHGPAADVQLCVSDVALSPLSVE